MGRPREHDDATGESLLDAAEALLAAGGPDAVSVRAVADVAGTTTRAVYSVFGSKIGLLQHLARRGYLHLADLVRELPVTGAVTDDLVRIGIEGFRHFAIGKPHLFRITFERNDLGLRDDSSVLLAARESYEALAEHVQRAQAEGLLGSRPVPEVAFQFHATCTGLATNELLTRDPPIGVRMWAAVLPEPDWIALWRGALGALLAGLAVEESSTPA